MATMLYIIQTILYLGFTTKMFPLSIPALTCKVYHMSFTNSYSPKVGLFLFLCLFLILGHL